MSFESITRSAMCWCAANVPAWCSSLSTRVVFPWSTWAMIAIFRRGRLMTKRKFEKFQYFSIGLLLCTMALEAAGQARTSAVPTLSIGQPSSEGDLDKAIIRRYIKRNEQKLVDCYAK